LNTNQFHVKQEKIHQFHVKQVALSWRRWKNKDSHDGLNRSVKSRQSLCENGSHTSKVIRADRDDKIGAQRWST